MGEEELNNFLLQNAFFSISKGKTIRNKAFILTSPHPNPLQQERASELHPAFYAE